jgi:hypothetical protein
MKRQGLVILIVCLAAIPALSLSNFINLGYNIQSVPDNEYSRRGIGVVYTHLGGEGSGFYAQIAPFFATSWKSYGVVGKFSDYDLLGIGLPFTLGYGHDFNFGQMGLILGGGFFASAYIERDSYYGSLYYNSAAGVGAGAHFYFQPGSGSLVINAGVDFAWTPLYLYGDTDYGFGEFSVPDKKYNTNINVGVGFRR